MNTGAGAGVRLADRERGHGSGGCTRRGRNPAGRNPNRGTGNSGASHDLGHRPTAPRRSAAGSTRECCSRWSWPSPMVIGCAVLWAVGSLAGERAGRQPRPGRHRGRAGRRLAARCRITAICSGPRPRRRRRSPATPRSTASTTPRTSPAPGSSSTCPSGGPATSTPSAPRTVCRRSRTDGALTGTATVVREQPCRPGR